MCGISQESHLPTCKDPSLERLAVIKDPFKRARVHILDNTLDRAVELGEFLPHGLLVASKRPALLGVSQVLFLRGHESNDVQDLVLADGEDEEMLSRSEPGGRV